MKSKSNEDKKVYGNSRYLNPTNDVSFKKLFGTDDHKDLLISFLNSMLGLTGKKRIQQVELRPQELCSLFGDGKTSILDVQCTDASGTRYIVEMQNKCDPHFIKRMQMYTSHTYVSQLDKGKDHFELSPVVLLAVANYKVFPKKKHVISYHKMLDVETYEHDLKDISYVFIDLSKFHKTDPEELTTIVDKWLYFFKYWKKSKIPPDSITEPELLEAYDTMERFNWSAEELEYYFKTDIGVIDQESVWKAASEEGREEERVKAKIEKQEIQKKYEQEKKEIQEKANQQKITMVQGFLSQDVDITIIMQATGMSKSKIDKIARDISQRQLSA